DFPLMLTKSPANTGDSMASWLKQEVESLSTQDGELLRRLVELAPWTVEQAVGALDGSAVEVRLGIHKLRARGLVRRTDPLNRERPRFTVLNLARHFLRSETDPHPKPMRAVSGSGQQPPSRILAVKSIRVAYSVDRRAIARLDRRIARVTASSHS